jgi:copper(I)-binding protein
VSRPATAATVVVGALSAMVLSACGTGLQAQTYRESGRQDGGSTTVEGVAVRNLHVTAPLSGSTVSRDESAVIAGVLVNKGTVADALVGASSDVAAAATVEEAGQPTTSIPIPPRGTSTTTWSIVLSGLTRDLKAGQWISVTLVFDKAGRTTVQIPVRAGDNGLGQREAAQDPYGEK